MAVLRRCEARIDETTTNFAKWVEKTLTYTKPAVKITFNAIDLKTLQKP
jgi:hypothetical protein